jgi:excisionase family DNA binding protein
MSINPGTGREADVEGSVNSVPIDPDAYVSIKRAMAIVSVSRRTINNWLKAGKLTFIRTAGGSVRILVSSLWQTQKVKVER